MKKLNTGSKPYNEKNDSPQDAKATKGLTSKEKKMFEKMDKNHRKPLNQKEDSYMDKANVERIKERERIVKAREAEKPKKADDGKKKAKKK